jgi:putative membrane protein
MRHAVVVGTIALALAATPAFAQTKHKKAAKTVTDQSFVAKAAAGGMAEVELGKLAQDRGTSEQVKSFGKRMVEDHGRANDDLRSLAKNKNIALPTSLHAKDQALKDRLSKLSGPAFDRAYMTAMLTDHQKDVSEFKREAMGAQDPDVKAFASKTLPTLQDHLKLAQDTGKVVGTSGATMKKKAIRR